MSREEQKEQERLRKEAIMQAERERHLKYKKQEEEREAVRQNLRDKYKIGEVQMVMVVNSDVCPAEKPEREEESEDEDDCDGFGPKKKEEDLDPVAREYQSSVGRSGVTVRVRLGLGERGQA